MRIFLYILLGLLVVGGALFTWAYFTLLHVQSLDLKGVTDPDERVSKVDLYLQKLQKKNQFNGAILLKLNGEIKLCKTYGYTDHTKKVPLTKQSSFRLASVSKQFTSAAILVLYDQNKLDIDQTVDTYLPNFPYPNITVRHLLNQTSGLPPNQYFELAETHKAEVGPVLSISETVDLVAKYGKPVVAAPNEVYAYDNTNYVLLAGIVEAVSGQSFEVFLSENLFQPLGMSNSRVWNLLSPDSTFVNKTQDFEQIAKLATPLKPTWIDGVAGDGAVFSSIEDFIIWDEFWNENDLISKENLAKAFEQPTLQDGSQSDYGFGWVINDKVSMHNGAWLGARTFYARRADAGNCLVLLDNSSNERLDKIAEEISKIGQ